MVIHLGKERSQDQAMPQSKSKAIYKYARISPKKVMPVLNAVRGRRVFDAVNFLTFDKTKAAKMLLKTLNSALANARQAGVEEKGLIVQKAAADPAPTFKRGRPNSRSNYSKILKRNAHLTIVLADTVVPAETKEGN
ncbi:MAG: 50S ribosomal protein L22 [candidate division WWE3 bacterium GW2011_GWB1_44_4]|uniref:Large ribosomal subunit protein uL22 n=5 Tax=Katanobacteria TaxID=422282 RepID=A0A0G1KN89_UNCKA|nr:MAG: 50S ribosomal protein L22 [candidate division WWE3 bacterium GW2011_GWA2_44_16]KKT70147.1 MAG: 50S ribosomal protein L22 [candidate division WWE3 bacterium GW2011_GWB1_44_4]KKT85003.1 MAG: 50S ribosomal protein L22 [candidate division WWE3 bacterium GW2011_GWC2_44_9]